MTTEDMKMQTLVEMRELLRLLNCKKTVLSALDSDSTGNQSYDLHDQLHTMDKVQTQFEEVVERAVKISVPFDAK